MKRLIAILCILATTVFICGCGKTSVNQKADVTLTFIREGVDIRITLPEDEAEQVRNILDGNRYDPVLSGIPACGFDKNVSVTVGMRVFAIACDQCNNVQDLGNLRYFDIPKENMEYIRALFEKYGGYFPCN